MTPLFLKMMNYWPPYLGAGIRVKSISPDWLEIHVEMKLRFWNKNYVRTQFGGSLYSMCDPFFMLILMQKLGREYIVWDKESTIRFKKPGRGTVSARFRIEAEEISRIKQVLQTERKTEPRYQAQIVDAQGEVIAEVDKLLYVRKKSS